MAFSGASLYKNKMVQKIKKIIVLNISSEFFIFYRKVCLVTKSDTEFCKNITDGAKLEVHLREVKKKCRICCSPSIYHFKKVATVL